MRVQEDSAEGATSVRLGSVAPLLGGQSFTLNRVADPPPLPDRAQVVWVDAAGTHDARMSIDEVVAASTGSEALVFDLQPTGIVRVYLESRPPNNRASGVSDGSPTAPMDRGSGHR